jgi:hypothetical protein
MAGPLEAQMRELRDYPIESVVVPSSLETASGAEEIIPNQ